MYIAADRIMNIDTIIITADIGGSAIENTNPIYFPKAGTAIKCAAETPIIPPVRTANIHSFLLMEYSLFFYSDFNSALFITLS